MKKIGIIISVLVVFALGSFTVYSINSKHVDESLESNINTNVTSRVSKLRVDSEETEETDIIVNASEIEVSEEQLIDDSEVIIKGKITEKLGEYDYRCVPDAYNSEGLLITRSLYECEVLEVLKGDNVETIKISFAGTIMNGNIEIGKEAIFCMVTLTGDFEDTYTLLSSTQAIFEVDGDVITNVKGDSSQLKDFKNSIEQVHQKNKKGITIEKVTDKIKR